MEKFITVVHIVTCALVVIVVLMQSGKGAEISATLGGSSQTVFGSTGGANFFQKLTYGLAVVFMATSLLLTIMGNKSQQSVFDGATPAARTEAAKDEAANQVTQPPTGNSGGAATTTGAGAPGGTTTVPTKNTTRAVKTGEAPAAKPAAPAAGANTGAAGTTTAPAPAPAAGQ